MVTCQQLVQHQSQRIHVRLCRDLCAGELFGRRAQGREHHNDGLRQLVARRIQQLCDAEIEQLHATVAVNEHIARLQIPMHDQASMGVRHGVTDLDEEVQSIHERQAAPGDSDR